MGGWISIGCTRSKNRKCSFEPIRGHRCTGQCCSGERKMSQRKRDLFELRYTFLYNLSLMCVRINAKGVSSRYLTCGWGSAERSCKDFKDERRNYYSCASPTSSTVQVCRSTTHCSTPSTAVFAAQYNSVCRTKLWTAIGRRCYFHRKPASHFWRWWYLRGLCEVQRFPCQWELMLKKGPESFHPDWWTMVISASIGCYVSSKSTTPGRFVPLFI